MQHYIALIFGFVCLVLPLQTTAMRSTVWDLRQNFAQQLWQANTNLLMTQTPNGVRFQPKQAEATLQRAVDTDHAIDAVRIHYSSPKTVEIQAMWSTQASGENMYMAPVSLPKVQNITAIDIDYARYDTWDSRPTSIGFWLPEGADVTIESVELLRWNPFEKTIAMLRGLWHFGTYRAYSVNFLWGPRIAKNPVQNTQMFWTQPPGAPSANWILYIVLAGSALYVWYKKKPLQVFIGVVACVWLVYDVRMGAELLQYALTDIQAYHSKDIGSRTFRDRSYFNDFAEAITPVVQNEEKYIFLSQERWPYLGLIRYYTYPSIPTQPFNGNANIYRTWVVYQRPDITQNSQGQLVSGQQTLSPPGTIVHEFGPGTFLFTANL